MKNKNYSKKIKFSELLKNLSRIGNLNLNKIFFSVFILMLLNSCVGVLTVMPSYVLLSSENSTLASDLLSYFLLFCGNFLWFMIQFSFAVMLLRMVRGQFVSVGYLFYSFRKFREYSPCALLCSCVTAFVFIFSKIILKVVEYFKSSFFEILKSTFGETQSLFVISGIILFISLFFLFGMIFVPQVKYDNNSFSAFKVLRTSFRLSYSHFFKIIAFAFVSCIRYLIFALLYLAFSIYFSKKENGASSVFSFLFDFLYFINFYKAISFVFLSIPVFYQELISPVVEIDLPLIDENNNENENSTITENEKNAENDREIK